MSGQPNYPTIPPRPQPGWLQVPNNIAFLWQNPCGAPGTVYLETIWPVLGEAILTYVSFGLSDIVRGYFTPKTIRSRSRWGRRGEDRDYEGRDRRYRKLRRRGIPEVGNEIGEHLPGAKYFHGLPVGNRSRWIFHGINIFEMGMFWLMIADLGKTAIYKWAEAVWLEACKPDANPKNPHWVDSPYSPPGNQPCWYDSNTTGYMAYPGDTTSTYDDVSKHNMTWSGFGQWDYTMRSFHAVVVVVHQTITVGFGGFPNETTAYVQLTYPGPHGRVVERQGHVHVKGKQTINVSAHFYIPWTWAFNCTVLTEGYGISSSYGSRSILVFSVA